MIDVSKYEKVGEFKDGRLHWLEGRDINAVYLIKFKEDFYIGSAEYLYIRIKEHVKSFLHCEHTEKMQEVFENEGVFDVYVIERGVETNLLKNREMFFIKELEPTLNIYRPKNSICRLRDIMDSKEMKSVELANRLGVTKQTISNMLNGRVMPSLETINKIAEILQVPMWQIFADPNEVRNTQPSQGALTIKCDKCGNIIKVKEIKVEQ